MTNLEDNETLDACNKRRLNVLNIEVHTEDFKLEEVGQSPVTPTLVDGYLLNKQMDELLDQITSDPSYTPYINDNDGVFIKHLAAYVKSHEDMRSFDCLMDLMENKLEISNRVSDARGIALDILSLTHTESNDIHAVIDAQEAVNRIAKSREDYDRINNSGLPYLKKRVMLEILSHTMAGTDSFVFCMGSREIMDWLIELGYTVTYNHDDLMIKI